MALFDVQERATKEDDSKIAKKTKTKKPTAVKSSGIIGKIEAIRDAVETKLGKYKDEYIVINEPDGLHNYLDACINNRYISIDTETTGLNPLADKLVGICIYTYGQKGAYIPVNHISYITGEKSAKQLEQDFVVSEFNRLLDSNPDIDMFNSVFDIRFLRHFGLDRMYCTWDSMLASRILNENEPKGQGGLKDLHNKYCLNGKGDAWSFGDLFKGITFDKIPYNIGYLYAARDPVVTSELCDFQRKYLRADSDKADIRAMYMVFKKIEMPIVQVVCDMEDTGVEFDFKKNAEFKEKYHKLLDERDKVFQDECAKYSREIAIFDRNHPSVLDNPINIKSVPQLQALLYDIVKIEPQIDKRTKKEVRGTSEDVLKQIDHPIAKAILSYREFSTIVSTFIDKLPECVQSDGRIHCKFNQYGADTGRFSSSDPNLQNIPSHNKEIRQMFKATDGYVLMSSDFSQQEPKCLAALCRKHGDSQMYDTFMQGKDLYSEIASKAFNKAYEECREFNPDGSTNKDGKARRTQAKSILLGVLYGRGTASIGEQLGCTTEKAEEIKNSVFRGFPAIKQFEQDSLNMAHDLGYVTTVCGRKRRLPDLQLDEFEFEWKNGQCPYDDPLDFTMTDSLPIPNDKVKYYLGKLSTARFKEKQKVFAEADKENIHIVDNGKKIADATRQCVNARIQGSAADLTKLAMIKLHQSDELKKLGFRILIPVHDEIIAECPEENAEECSKLLADTMSRAAEEILEMPIKCDVEVTYCWYGEEVNI